MYENVSATLPFPVNDPARTVDGKIVLVGCGNMGRALLEGWLRDGYAAESLTVIDPVSPEVPAGVRVLDAPRLMSAPEVLVLAIKPQLLAKVAPGLVAMAGPDTLLVSVLAAVEVATLRHFFPQVRAVMRAVPNLPSAIGQGVTALVADGLDAEHRAVAGMLFAPLGAIEWLDREALCDAATSVSGCGPAFLFRFAEAVAAAGERQGLSRQQALRLIAATMAGTGTMLRDPAADPAVLARRVASPGGVTMAGLEVLDADAALNRLVAATLDAAAKRNAHMMAATRPAAPGRDR